MTRAVLLIVLVPALLWALLAWPAWQLGGEDELIVSGTALALCVVPAALSAPLVVRRSDESATADLLAVMAAPLFRMLVVAGGVLILVSRVPFFGINRQGFAGWVILFYLTCLGLELWLVSRSRRTNPGN